MPSLSVSASTSLLLYVKFFHHGHTQSVQSVVHLMILYVLVVAQERENQTSSSRRIGIAGKRLHMLDRTSLRVNPSHHPSLLHTVAERAIDSRRRQRVEVDGKPGLLLCIQQQR